MRFNLSALLLAVFDHLAFGAVKFLTVKQPGNAASKWVSRAQGAGQAYTDGVNASSGWAAPTEAAAGSWQAGVTAAASSGRFAKGVAAAGDQTWKNGAVNKGAARYPQGVSQAQGKYATKVTPYFNAMASLTLPPRGPKGDPGNYTRSAAVGVALRKLKLGQ